MHRHDVGQLPKQTIARLEETERRVDRPSLFGREGVRAVHLNELNRATAGRMAGAFASLLWDEAPHFGRCDQVAELPRAAKRRGPAIVIGHDERPAAPDLLSGVAATLKRMGCHVVDIGLTTRPCFCFTVHHLQAAGGIFVTGSGCEPSWTGMDFVGRHAAAFSQGDRLTALEARFNEGYARPTRQSGTHRMFRAGVPYQAGLWKHFHALRPLEVVVATPLRTVRALLEDLGGKLPCRLDLLPLPVRIRRFDPDDDDVLRVGRRVCEQGADLGVIIDDDGCRTAIVDEQGRLIEDSSVLLLLADLLRAEHPRGVAILGGEKAEHLALHFHARNLHTRCVGLTWSHVEHGLQQPQSCLAYAGEGRYYFRDSRAVCDGIATFAHILQALSRSDARCSSIVAELSPGPPEISGPSGDLELQEKGRAKPAEVASDATTGQARKDAWTF